MTRHWRQTGFTLIEVLVALAILAIAMAALTYAAGGNTANASHLRDRTIGMWVAENRLAELRISKDWVDIGAQTGEMEMAGHNWHWRTVTEKIANEETQEFMRAVTVEVRVNPKQKTPSATLHGFVGNPRFSSTGTLTN